MMDALKPLNWKQKTGVRYSVSCRADGGLNPIFTDLSDATMAEAWLAKPMEQIF